MLFPILPITGQGIQGSPGPFFSCRNHLKARKTQPSKPTDLDDSTHQEFNTRDEDVIPTPEAQDERQWHPSSSPAPDREWHLTKTVSDLPPQPWITHLA
ncbi:hypothetical protein Tco_1312149 [Tanacetum coccineum]